MYYILYGSHFTFLPHSKENKWFRLYKTRSGLGDTVALHELTWIYQGLLASVSPLDLEMVAAEKKVKHRFSKNSVCFFLFPVFFFNTFQSFPKPL